MKPKQYKELKKALGCIIQLNLAILEIHMKHETNKMFPSDHEVYRQKKNIDQAMELLK